ncbi:hypothetical protein Cgig2_005537 [Carnegiea gigantea]|uniref:Uncharacterized protein n=1 Tax=Carnegiea gigantea TaxID=171969 RepID=A0A9Q1KUY5_9CARY|nr:hypothetical protein Cgig2_005537 [Carnegiea gigantea]
MQGHKGKPTIEQWISFWFRGCNKYHEPVGGVIVRPFSTSWEWLLANLHFFPIGYARSSCQLDAGCIRPGTFSIASLMASGIGYCLPTAILASIYKGLNELSHSLHPGRSGGHFPAHFRYAWLAKNFDIYDYLVTLVEPSRFGLKRPKNSLVLGGAFAGIHPSSTDLRRLLWMTISYRGPTLLILSAFVRVLSLTVVKITSSWSTINRTDSVDNLTSTIFLVRKQCFAVITCSRTMEQGPKSYFLDDTLISSTCNPHASDSKRKRSDLSDTNTLEDEGKLGSKPKLMIVRSRKPLEPFVPPMEDGSFRVKIPRIDVVIPAMPIPVIPI